MHLDATTYMALHGIAWQNGKMSWLPANVTCGIELISTNIRKQSRLIGTNSK